ncbi:MAG: hypothetical protein HQL37_16185, partial [Alphaproteobacteria bacterium]|nr:hypothetical protein [Alphaproteobacteria bacterium]
DRFDERTWKRLEEPLGLPPLAGAGGAKRVKPAPERQERQIPDRQEDQGGDWLGGRGGDNWL